MSRRDVLVCVPNDAVAKRLFAVVNLDTGEEAFVVSSWIRRQAPAKPRVPGLVPVTREATG